MSSIATSNYRRRRKANLIKVCGNKCSLCGYDKLQNALEFHHLNPEEKSYGVSSQGVCHDLETDLQEVRKCILVCANCHREIHADFYSLEELKEKQIFDEKFAQTLRDEKSQKSERQIYYCSSCGKEISRYSKSGLCDSCVRKTKRITERPSREELKKMIREFPFTKIGEKYNVSDNAIRKWCKSENLPVKKTEINKITDAQWELI